MAITSWSWLINRCGQMCHQVPEPMGLIADHLNDEVAKSNFLFPVAFSFHADFTLHIPHPIAVELGLVWLGFNW